MALLTLAAVVVLSVGIVPPEPGAVVLPEAAVLQVVAGDVDGDGRRELVRVVRDATDGTQLEVWRLAGDRWGRAGDPAPVFPPARPGRREDRVYVEAALRLLVLNEPGRERVIVASQPRFDFLDAGPECCLLLDEVTLAGDGVVLRAVADPTEAVDTLLAIDLDGDGTDALLATRSGIPSANAGLPLEARVYAWDGGRFGAPTTTHLSSGGGGVPFLLGDTDGRPGAEAGLLGAPGAPGLHRIGLADDGSLTIEGSGLEDAASAKAVALPDGPGLAVTSSGSVALARWPAGTAATIVARAPLLTGELLGVVGADEPWVVVAQATGALRALRVPDLEPIPELSLPRSPAAALLAGTSARPYAGPLPGGGPDGGPAIIAGGYLVPWSDGGARSMGALGGAAPIGLLGDRDWLGLTHADVPLGMLLPEGGRFEPLTPRPGAWESIAPLGPSLDPERGEGTLDAEARGAGPFTGRVILVGPAGFEAVIEAPPGSRVVAFGAGSAGQTARHAVPDDGRLELTLPPRETPTANARYQQTLAVLTPSGRSYLTSWHVQLLSEPPALDAEVETRLGRVEVTVTGRTARYATVSVDGAAVPVAEDGSFRVEVPVPPWPTDLRVEARDPVDNRASLTVSAVGLFDYRDLPWIPIVGGLVVVAAAVLFLRAPRLRAGAGGEEDALEDLDAD